MPNPKISVVTVCYNAASTIEETMLSVLNQTYDNVEYIIIDGGSTDGTVDIIKKYTDRLAYWVSEPDRGIYDAMNKGIAVATGDYINFMNAGDRFYNDSTISNCFNSIISNPTFIYGDWVESIDDYLKISKKALHLKYLKSGMPFPHQSVFINTSYHKKNPYDLKYSIASDYNLIFTAYCRNETFVYVNMPISIYDLSPDKSMSLKNYKTLINEHLRIQGRNKFIIDIISQKKTIEFRIRGKLKSMLPSAIVTALKQFLNRHQKHPII